MILHLTFNFTKSLVYNTYVLFFSDRAISLKRHHHYSSSRVIFGFCNVTQLRSANTRFVFFSASSSSFFRSFLFSIYLLDYFKLLSTVIDFSTRSFSPSLSLSLSLTLSHTQSQLLLLTMSFARFTVLN